jgi:hypothetical protein
MSEFVLDIEYDASKHRYEPASRAVQRKVMYPKQVFALVQKLGCQNPIYYGGALRDAAHGVVPMDHDFIATAKPGPFRHELPAEQFRRRFGQEVMAAKLDQLGAKMEHYGHHGREGELVHLCFNFQARKIDLTISRKPVSLSEVLANTNLGLSAIAMNADGDLYVANRFLQDSAMRSITISPDLSKADRERALSKAFALRERSYPSFMIQG